MDIGQLYKEHHADSHAAALQMVFDAGKKVGFAEGFTQGHAAALAELPAIAPVETPPPAPPVDLEALATAVATEVDAEDAAFIAGLGTVDSPVAVTDPVVDPAPPAA